jgi:hypothetical protein
MWNGMFLIGKATAVWDDQPGGKVVGEYTDPFTGTKYVLVEFEKSPGKLYVYYAKEES